MSRYDWMENAACTQADPDLFHSNGHGAPYRRAQAICNSCPVQPQCADFANTVEGGAGKRSRHGLWAGKAPRQREANANRLSRQATHELILRLHDRGGMKAKQIAEAADCDERTVYRVVKQNRTDAYQEAA
ncbi:WhiB family transcriptional regulator [Streptomyces sp. NPDC060027]|uniref:WhiB family transcriptional regulator n=1 Tax=Streptomyces sp. NPDC060027 TaxID=3347040 RepID=UPI0036AC579A